jgi:Pectinacetylesterase
MQQRGLRRTKRQLVIALATVPVVGLLGACGGADDSDASVGTDPHETVPLVPTTAAPAAWRKVEPGGDCQCADGSAFSLWVREANPQKVVFYLQDGGACFSAETCAPENDLYKTRVDDGPAGERGIFDFADPRNPFADDSVVYVPYCTGDVHIGDADTEYAPGLTVHHKGYVNGTAAVDQLIATFADATEIVVIGDSAGSIAAPLYAGLIADRLPAARITVLADGSGSYPDDPAINEIIAGWGGHGSFPGMFISSGRRDPDIVFARHDYAYDETQQSYLELVGITGEDLLALMDANEAQIEDRGVDLLSYVAPGAEHTVVSDGRFYTETVGGEPLVDWVTRLIQRESVADVRCTACAPG